MDMTDEENKKKIEAFKTIIKINKFTNSDFKKDDNIKALDKLSGFIKNNVGDDSYKFIFNNIVFERKNSFDIIKNMLNHNIDIFNDIMEPKFFLIKIISFITTNLDCRYFKMIYNLLEYQTVENKIEYLSEILEKDKDDVVIKDLSKKLSVNFNIIPIHEYCDLLLLYPLEINDKYSLIGHVLRESMNVIIMILNFHVNTITRETKKLIREITNIKEKGIIDIIIKYKEYDFEVLLNAFNNLKNTIC